MGTQSKASLVLNLVLVAVVYSETIQAVVSADSANIALLKPSFMSSMSNEGGLDIKLTNDGENITTNPDMCIVTMEEDNPWWAVDLREEFVVSDIKIFMSDNELRRFGDVSILVGNVSPLIFEYTEEHQGLIECNTYAGDGDTSEGEAIDIGCGKLSIGRYVFIVVTNTTYMQLCEVEVYHGERNFVCVENDDYQNSDQEQWLCYEYMGCYHDVEGDRDIHPTYSMSTRNTPANCIKEHCAPTDTVVGLHYNSGCRCGNSYGKHGADSESACSATCTGNISLFCGGYLHNSVYRKIATDEYMCKKHGYYLSPEDRCNQCFCHDDLRGCTELKCDALEDGCMYGRTKISFNETFPSWNKCDQCRCMENNGTGIISCDPDHNCTSKQDSKFCSYDGMEYRVGDMWKSKDECNSCFCEHHAVSCTDAPICRQQLPQNLEENVNCALRGSPTDIYTRGTQFTTDDCTHCFCAKYGVIACAYTKDCRNANQLKEESVSNAEHAGIGTGCLSFSIISSVLYLIALF